MSKSENIDNFLKQLFGNMESGKYDCNYSEFDFEKHAETYINYLEICIDEFGKVYYATPSHTIFLEHKYMEINNLTDEEFREVVNSVDVMEDWLEWLCKNTGFIVVWDNFIRGFPNTNQKRTLKKLSNMKYVRCNSFLYQGELNF